MKLAMVDSTHMHTMGSPWTKKAPFSRSHSKFRPET